MSHHIQTSGINLREIEREIKTLSGFLPLHPKRKNDRGWIETREGGLERLYKLLDQRFGK